MPTLIQTCTRLGVLALGFTIMACASGSRKGSTNWSVGMMWSTVANVRCGIATFSPKSRNIPNAWGLVTS